MIKSANELDSFLENVDPIIVLDSSVILDLYKYAPEITENLLIILEEDIKTKIWLPGQVLEEFNNNHEKIYNRKFSSFENVPEEPVVEDVTLFNTLGELAEGGANE